jgi:hypothetical protein
MSKDFPHSDDPSYLQRTEKQIPKVAVVYVHGMGLQRRNEETSRLIDALDYYLVSRSFIENTLYLSQKYLCSDAKYLKNPRWAKNLQTASPFLRFTKTRENIFEFKRFPLQFSGPIEGLQYEKIIALPLNKDRKTYIRPQEATYFNKEEKFKITFYEAYWAPEVAGNVNSFQVILWLLKQIFIPFRILHSNWDTLATIRKNTLIKRLHSEWHRERNRYEALGEKELQEIDEKIHINIYRKLMDRYLYFLRADLAQHDRSFLNRFKVFLLNTDHLIIDPDAKIEPKYVETQKTAYFFTKRLRTQTIKIYSRFKKIEKFKPFNFFTLIQIFGKKIFSQKSKFSTDSTRKLLREWRFDFIKSQIYAIIAIILVFCALFEFFIFILYLYQLSYNSKFAIVYEFFKLKNPNFEFLKTEFPTVFIYSLPLNLNAVVSTILVVAIAYFFPKINIFLMHYLGDVMQWSTYNESNLYSENRKKILSATKDVIFSAIRSDCEKVIIVGHSLGSAIALDSLISIFNESQSVNDESYSPKLLNKIKSFFTLGSPIDKIYYFFESHSSEYSHHNYFIEQNRGNMKKWRESKIYSKLVWVNFYDHSDLISGPVYSHNGISVSSKKEFNLPDHLWNIPINYYRYGSLNRSHTAYFNHTHVVESVWKAISEDSESLNSYIIDNYKSFAQNSPKNLYWQAGFFFGLAPLIIINLFFFNRFRLFLILFLTIQVFLIFFTTFNKIIPEQWKLFNSEKHISEL